MNEPRCPRDEETQRHAHNQNDEILHELRGMRKELSEIKQDLARGETMFAQFAPVPAIVNDLKTEVALFKQELERLKSITYGVVGLVLTSVVGAVLMLVVKAGQP